MVLHPAPARFSSLNFLRPVFRVGSTVGACKAAMRGIAQLEPSPQLAGEGYGEGAITTICACPLSVASSRTFGHQGHPPRSPALPRGVSCHLQGLYHRLGHGFRLIGLNVVRGIRHVYQRAAG